MELLTFAACTISKLIDDFCPHLSRRPWHEHYKAKLIILMQISLKTFGSSSAWQLIVPSILQSCWTRSKAYDCPSLCIEKKNKQQNSVSLWERLETQWPIYVQGGSTACSCFGLATFMFFIGWLPIISGPYLCLVQNRAGSEKLQYINQGVAVRKSLILRFTTVATTGP